MDFRDSPEEAEFRKVVQAFIKEEAPQVERGASREEALLTNWDANQKWFKKMADRGWIAPAWPEEYGGAGMSVMQQFIFNEEMAKNRAPRPLHMIIGLGMAGPTIITHGTDKQKEAFLPGMLSGDDIWCQGYSEPESGSDLASLKTKAVRDGDDYVINGQKIWTTLAHMAKWMIMLARTDPDAPKHKGITYFIADMKAPGVTVRPLMNMADAHEFNEVFFDNVRIPKENIIGEENRGWYTAVTTLDFERSAIGSATGMKQSVEALVDYAREHKNGHTSALATNPMLRYELSDRMVEVEVGRMLSYRVASMQNRGLIPNYEASLLKLYTTELNQRIASTGVHILGPYGLLKRGSELAPNNGRNSYTYLRSVAYTIEGGTSEVQRNIIAQRGLGLPRD
ncbi:MAG: acyl-CoA dehydrogenase family protein [Chloroflexi bacterium]|nr:acyl-CoA dehydrogenase family protein [Chloroflexota bacterium]